MVKLLELCKSYVDLRAEAPEPRSKGSTRTKAGDEDHRADLFIPAVRDVGRESFLPQQHAPRSSPVEQQREPTMSETLEPRTLSDSRSAEVEGLYGRTIDQVSRFFEAAATEAISLGSLRAEAAKTEDLAADLALAPQAGEDLLVEAMRTSPDGERSVVSHSAFVAVLAAYVGHKLGLSAVRLTDTCLAGLTHDVGSVRLSPDALDHEASLSPQKFDELRKRPEYSREILKSLGDRYSAAAEIAYQVYERLDGSGYPRGIRKDEILSEARVLGAVDFFETVVHPQPSTGTLVGGVTYGLQTLVRMTGQFGRDTLKALVHCIGIFPVGTYVCLSTGEIGRVVSTSRSNPMRPIVDVVLDRKKRRVKMPKSVDLVHSPQLYVSRPLSNSDVVDLGLLNHTENSDGGGSGEFPEARALPERNLPSSSRSELGSSVPE